MPGSRKGAFLPRRVKPGLYHEKVLEVKEMGVSMQVPKAVWNTAKFKVLDPAALFVGDFPAKGVGANDLRTGGWTVHVISDPTTRFSPRRA